MKKLITKAKAKNYVAPGRMRISKVMNYSH